MANNLIPNSYTQLLNDLKERIRTAQLRSVLSVNRELILLYWQIGREILKRQKEEGWGIYGWRDKGKQILAIALRSQDKEAVATAENLIHFLGSRGYFEFRDLLQRPL